MCVLVFLFCIFVLVFFILFSLRSETIFIPQFLLCGFVCQFQDNFYFVYIKINLKCCFCFWERRWYTFLSWLCHWWFCRDLQEWLCCKCQRFFGGRGESMSVFVPFLCSADAFVLYVTMCCSSILSSTRLKTWVLQKGVLCIVVKKTPATFCSLVKTKNLNIHGRLLAQAPQAITSLTASASTRRELKLAK